MASKESYETRFAHTHVLGGSGHGKTQLLQTLIYRDLQSPVEPSVVVIDSQGDLINTISHLKLFDPEASRGLADRLLLIDPTDIEYPPAVNLFDANLDRIAKYGAVERERIMNGTIELYEYFFGALLGAGLSQKQNLIFRYLAQLMIIIPSANIHTLRELLETPEAFQDDIAKLDGTARLFFEQQFFHKSYDDTRVQVSRRLRGILANRSFERIFSSRTSRIDLFEAMNAGKIILINTSKDLLKQDGAAIFGRFFIAMIAQAALERAQIPRDERRPTFVYIDEAQDYFDENIDHMLEQVRKYKIGLTLAHQTLAQLDTKLKASIMANTGTKLVGGMSASDAVAIGKEMGCNPTFLQSMRKTETTTSFALWIKNQTPRPREITVKLGSVDALPCMSADSYDKLVALNIEKYCLPVAEMEMPTTAEEPITPEVEEAAPTPQETPSNPKAPVVPAATAEKVSDIEPVAAKEPPDLPERKSPQPTAPKPPIPKPSVTPMGQGGADHIYLQKLITKVAQQKGFHATIEQTVLDGAGRVDVLLTHGEVRVGCEISISTDADHEAGNAEKCLKAGCTLACMIATKPRHLDRIKKATLARVPVDQHEKLHFFQPEQFIFWLKNLEFEPATAESTVAGYAVKVKRSTSGKQADRDAQAVIGGLVAKSLNKRATR